MGTIANKMKQGRLPYCSAVIVAGGSSARFGADKLFVEIQGQPVLGRSIAAVAACSFIREIVLVVREEIISSAEALAKQFGCGKVCRIVRGGSSRAESVFAGISAISAASELVAIHDGARPLIDEKTILDTVWEAYRHMAAAPAVAVKDTIKTAEEGMVCSTPDRSRLFAVQTPQVFRKELIFAALQSALEKNIPVTDDCSAVEIFGVPVFLTEGREENIKITTPLDIDLAEAILRRRGL